MLYLYFRVSGTLGPGFSGAARFSLSRRGHVKAKGPLDSVEQKNYAVGEQKVGQPRRPTSCVLSFVEAENWAGVVQRARPTRASDTHAIIGKIIYVYFLQLKKLR